MFGTGPPWGRLRVSDRGARPDHARWPGDGLAFWRSSLSSNLRERTWAGLVHARANGKQLGRSATATVHAAEIWKLHRPGVSKSRSLTAYKCAEPRCAESCRLIPPGNSPSSPLRTLAEGARYSAIPTPLPPSDVQLAPHCAAALVDDDPGLQGRGTGHVRGDEPRFSASTMGSLDLPSGYWVSLGVNR